MNFSITSNNILVIYNTCGLLKRNNFRYYKDSIDSILSQDIPEIKVVISDCCSDEETRCQLVNAYPNIVTCWVNQPYPINVTFNLAVLECVKHFGAFESYLYVDSGVILTNNNTISKLYECLNSGPFGAMTSQSDTDNGYNIWGISASPTNITTIGVGRACNTHCNLISEKVRLAYNGKILPDIFAGDTSESVHSFLYAAIGLRWGIAPVSVHHVPGIDGASLSHGRGARMFVPTKNIYELCGIGHPFGFGYEECNHICMHLPEKFDEHGCAIDPNLYPFLRDNMFVSKEEFDYDTIPYEFCLEH